MFPNKLLRLRLNLGLLIFIPALNFSNKLIFIPELLMYLSKSNLDLSNLKFSVFVLLRHLYDYSFISFRKLKTISHKDLTDLIPPLFVIGYNISKAYF